MAKNGSDTYPELRKSITFISTKLSLLTEINEAGISKSKYKIKSLFHQNKKRLEVVSTPDLRNQFQRIEWI